MESILGSEFSLDMSVHRGAGAYICGEETAMLESLEGKAGNPRAKPPYPAQVGLFGLPTLVHNIETLACIPQIIQRGPEWFASIGSAESKGPKIFSVSDTSTGRGIMNCRSAPPCVKSSTNMLAESAVAGK